MFKNKMFLLMFVFSTFLHSVESSRLTSLDFDGGGKILLSLHHALSIEENCGVLGKKFLYPTEVTENHNIVLLASPLNYAFTNNVNINEGILEINDIFLGKKVLGGVLSSSETEITFRPTKYEKIEYDLNTKFFELRETCRYTLKNEAILILFKNNMDILNLINASRILTLEQSLYGVEGLMNKFEILGATLVQLEKDIAEIRQLITIKKDELDNVLRPKRAELVKKVDALVIERDKYLDLILTGEDDQQKLELELNNLEKQIVELDTEILRVQAEVIGLATIYEEKFNTMFKQGAVLESYLETTFSNDIELKTFIESKLIPETIRKYKYDVKYLKGDIMPTKLIHVDQ